MTSYVTKSGDTFDMIAYRQLGSCNFTPDVINANRNFIPTMIFSAGVKLNIPEVEKSKSASLPPWKR